MTGEHSKKQVWHPDPRLVTGVMTGFALLTPFSIVMSYDIDGYFWYILDALFWRYSSNLFPPLEIQLGNPILLLTRGWFIFEVYRAYQEYRSRSRLLIVGVLSESPLFFQMLFGFLLVQVGIPITFIPLPTLFLAGCVFLLLVPPVKNKGRKDDIRA